MPPAMVDEQTTGRCRRVEETSGPVQTKDQPTARAQAPGVTMYQWFYLDERVCFFLLFSLVYFVQTQDARHWYSSA